jgi:hypothetical protein
MSAIPAGQLREIMALVLASGTAGRRAGRCDRDELLLGGVEQWGRLTG